MDSGSPESKLYRDSEAVYVGLSTPARDSDSQLDSLTYGLGSMSIHKRRGSLDELVSDSSDAEAEQENEEYNRVRKRDYDRRTVEGSPVNDPVSKRLNTSKTPSNNNKSDFIDRKERRKSLGELVLRIKSYKQYLPAQDSYIGTSTNTISAESPLDSIESTYTDSESSLATSIEEATEGDKRRDKTSMESSPHSSILMDTESNGKQVYDLGAGLTPVLVVVSGGSEDHNTGDHQENALRTALLSSHECGALRRDALTDYLVWAPEECVYPAPTSDLLRVHEHSYLRHIQAKCDAAAVLEDSYDHNHGEDSTGNSNSTRPPLPAHYAPAGKLDVDTPLGPSSLRAARRFCGAAMFAVDCVMADKYNIAFTDRDGIHSSNSGSTTSSSSTSSVSNGGKSVKGGQVSNDSSDGSASSTAPTTNEGGGKAEKKKGRGRHRQDSTQKSGPLPPVPPLNTSTSNTSTSMSSSNKDNSSHGHNGRRTTTSNSDTSNQANIQPIQRAFVIGRPPGHHAGPSGCVVPPTFWKRPEMASNGFCLLNTAAVAAAYARYTYGREVEMNKVFHSNIQEGSVTKDNKNSTVSSKSSNSSSSSNSTMSRKSSRASTGRGEGSTRKPRIAIVDIDVHHGNGTEAIVRNLQPHSEAMPLPSSWSPVYRECYKPWLDEEDAKDTFFASVQLFSNEDFYPGTGCDRIELYDSHSNPEGINCINIALTPVGPGPWDPRARAKITQSNLKNSIQQASQEMRTKVASMLLPPLREFVPDLLIISAGFDAHYDDMYHYLNESDYHWLTTQLVNVCREVPNHKLKVVSILEGGYSLVGVTHHNQKKKEAPVREIQTRQRNNSVQSEEKDCTKDTPEGGDDRHGGLLVEHEHERGDTPSVPVIVVERSDENMFAQEPGDGGLVKSALAHVCAMSGKEYWV